MVSALTFEDVVEAFEHYLTHEGHDASEARSTLIELFDLGESPKSAAKSGLSWPRRTSAGRSHHRPVAKRLCWHRRCSLIIVTS